MVVAVVDVAVEDGEAGSGEHREQPLCFPKPVHRLVRLAVFFEGRVVDGDEHRAAGHLGVGGCGILQVTGTGSTMRLVLVKLPGDGGDFDQDRDVVVVCVTQVEVRIRRQ